ncbi:MAG: hypothetical protein JSR52_03675 [Planctomycetes bacterium]|nr:hypothetical protein [Planctomycetota bacterium]
MPAWFSGAQSHIVDFFHNVTPATPWVLVGGILCAIVLWSKGSRLVRPALTCTGALLGAAAGGALATPVASTLVGLAAGALVGGLAGYLSFRILSAGVAGLCVASLALGASIIYLDRQEHAIPPEARAPLSTDEASVLHDASDLWQRTLRGEHTEDSASELASQSRAAQAAAVLRDGVKSRYEALPEQSKLFVSASTAVGAMFGILIGLLFPRGIAALSTAGIGAAGMIAGGLMLAAVLHSPGSMQLAAEPARLLGPWAFLTLVGIWMQRPARIRLAMQPPVQPAPPVAPNAAG